MTGWLLFAVFLYMACAALIVAEVFVPSWGLLGTLSLLCLAGGIAIFFKYSVVAGCVGVVVAVVMVPTLLALAYRVFPRHAVWPSGDLGAGGPTAWGSHPRHRHACRVARPGRSGDHAVAAGGNGRFRRHEGGMCVGKRICFKRADSQGHSRGGNAIDRSGRK